MQYTPVLTRPQLADSQRARAYRRLIFRKTSGSTCARSWRRRSCTSRTWTSRACHERPEKRRTERPCRASVLTGATYFATRGARNARRTSGASPPAMPSNTPPRGACHPIRCAGRNLERPLSSSELDTIKWQEAGAAPGFVVINVIARAPIRGSRSPTTSRSGWNRNRA